MLDRYAIGEAQVNEQEFRAELAASGYECSEFQLAANAHKAEHTHPWSARLFILEGEITLDTPGGTHLYRPGDSCALDANTAHTERAGPNGVRGLVGKR